MAERIEGKMAAIHPGSNPNASSSSGSNGDKSGPPLKISGTRASFIVKGQGSVIDVHDEIINSGYCSGSANARRAAPEDHDPLQECSGTDQVFKAAAGATLKVASARICSDAFSGDLPSVNGKGSSKAGSNPNAKSSSGSNGDKSGPPRKISGTRDSFIVKGQGSVIEVQDVIINSGYCSGLATARRAAPQDHDPLEKCSGTDQAFKVEAGAKLNVARASICSGAFSGDLPSVNVKRSSEPGSNPNAKSSSGSNGDKSGPPRKISGTRDSFIVKGQGSVIKAQDVIINSGYCSGSANARRAAPQDHDPLEECSGTDQAFKVEAGARLNVVRASICSGAFSGDLPSVNVRRGSEPGSNPNAKSSSGSNGDKSGPPSKVSSTPGPSKVKRSGLSDRGARCYY